MIRTHEMWDMLIDPPYGGTRHSQEIADLKNALKTCEKHCFRNCGGGASPNASQIDTKLARIALGISIILTMMGLAAARRF